MRILIVDDSKAMRMIVKRTLRQAGFEGHEVFEAENGVDALNVIRSTAPDVVLSDWNMPQMGGLQLLQTLAGEGVPVRFGFVTSESTEDMCEAARQAGAKFFITKPFTPETFQSQLTPVLSGAVPA
jgi:two-component system chemotaxis response regulator CheY